MNISDLKIAIARLNASVGHGPKIARVQVSPEFFELVKENYSPSCFLVDQGPDKPAIKGEDFKQ